MATRLTYSPCGGQRPSQQLRGYSRAVTPQTLAGESEPTTFELGADEALEELRHLRLGKAQRLLQL